VGTHLGDFVVRMRQAGNIVMLGAWPSEDFLQNFAYRNYLETWQQLSLPPSTGELQQAA
jgi:hypothetical protein